VAVDVRAIGALQIDNNKFAFLQDDLGVTFGDIPFGQDDIVSLHPTDGDLVFVKLEFLAFTAFFLDYDTEHVTLVCWCL